MNTYQTHFANLASPNRETQYNAFISLLEATSQPVAWAYKVWDELVSWLTSPDDHKRARATQLLANLAKSDPENRISRDIDTIFAVTRDEKFVTARHTLQAFWKIGLVSDELRQDVVKRLAERFKDCAQEKNCTLIRYDIIVDLQKLFEATGDIIIQQKAQELIELEQDLKYTKKYTSALKS